MECRKRNQRGEGSSSGAGCLKRKKRGRGGRRGGSFRLGARKHPTTRLQQRRAVLAGEAGSGLARRLAVPGTPSTHRIFRRPSHHGFRGQRSRDRGETSALSSAPWDDGDAAVLSRPEPVCSFSLPPRPLRPGAPAATVRGTLSNRPCTW